MYLFALSLSPNHCLCVSTTKIGNPPNVQATTTERETYRLAFLENSSRSTNGKIYVVFFFFRRRRDQHTRHEKSLFLLISSRHGEQNKFRLAITSKSLFRKRSSDVLNRQKNPPHHTSSCVYRAANVKEN